MRRRRCGVAIAVQPFERGVAFTESQLAQNVVAARARRHSALEQDLAEKRGIIVLLNAETIWNRPGKRNAANHFVVVTGIDPKAGVVHLNDSGVMNGRDEQVPIATFEQAWAPNHNSAIVTK